jgi:hypothetical protein
VIVFLWSLWGELFHDARYPNGEARLLYRKLYGGPGWYSCGWQDPVEVFYLDPYLEEA